MGNNRDRASHFILAGILALALLSPLTRGAVPDLPFSQAVSRQILLPPDLRGTARQVVVDRDGIVYLRTDSGVARLFEDRVALDRGYRPLAGKIPAALTISEGRLFYLFADEILSNRDAGKFVHKLPRPFSHAAVNSKDEAVLASGRELSWLRDGQFLHAPPASFEILELLSRGEDFFARGSNVIFRLSPPDSPQPVAQMDGLTAAVFHRGSLVLGSTQGFEIVDPATGNVLLPLQQRLPATNITALASDGNFLWAATTQGVWRRSESGEFRYFASRRWLDSDETIDLALDPAGNAYILTSRALNIIEFQPMTLAAKARWYDAKIRQRHIRYGFSAELYLRDPGDITSAEMIDTDNDGTWSNYYMASQAFRFGATGDETARRNAWETFEAFERLEAINPLDGFPSRTFERAGFKLSDPERWHPVGDGLWDWKAHTSSDEIAAHLFGACVLYETTARTAAEKDRISRFVTRILDHIVRNNYYLIDVDGEPTLWGRWNPEYVNAYPRSIVDRRLNSAQLIAMLQFGHAISGRQIYKDKALELIEKHGYLENIVVPMSTIAPNTTFKHMGITMGDEWNHSDDLLAFVTYWVLHRHAFNDELRQQYAAAIRDHWQIERIEKNPIWNFVYAATGAQDSDLAGALWTLRRFPLDMISWTVINSHRRDITPMPPNFRGQQLEELLPPDERRISRWNTHPFDLDGGNGGRIEFAGDEFLLPYWMGRYLGLIEAD